jgi:uncharacterized protein
MPGIVVNTSVRTGPTNANQAPTASFFVVGETQRGPATTAKMVTSIAEYESIFGDFVSYGSTHQQVQTFFEEGGAQVFVSRVVGASATAGTLELQDTNGDPSITLTAAGPGAWSSSLQASVEDAGTGFQIKFFLNNELVYSTGERQTVSGAVNAINTSQLAARYATAVNEENLRPIVLVSTAFSAGTDDRTSITDATFVDGLQAFGEELGAGAIAIPGRANSTIWNSLLNHAASTNRMALLATPETATVNDAIAEAQGLAASIHTEYGGMFYPWVKIVTGAGTAMNISPEGFVAAKRSLAHNEIGPWSAYAGKVSESKFITGLVTPVSGVSGDALDDARVNALRIFNGKVRVYGARSLASDEDNYRFLTSREMLNYVVDRAKVVLEDLVFSPIDGRSSLFSKVEARLISMLEPIRISGGLYEAFDSSGERIDYGYSVQVNESINPLTQLAGGLVRAKVGIRVSSVGDQIQVDVTKSNLTASVV